MTVNKRKNTRVLVVQATYSYTPETRTLGDLIKTDPIRQKRQLRRDQSAWGVVEIN